MSEEDVEAAESREVFLDELCKRQQYFLGLFAFAAIFLVVQFPYLFVLEPDSGLYVIATLNVVGSSVFTLGFGSILWVCRNRET